MRLRVDSPAKKLLTLAIVTCLLLPYAWISIRRYRAAGLVTKGDRRSLLRAIQLEPGDSYYRTLLARQLLFLDQDTSGALVSYQAAASINPYAEENWIGIAQAELVAGNEDKALDAVRYALHVDPKTPSVAWDAANLLVTLGHTDEAMSHFRFAMASDPSTVPQAIALLRRIEPSPAVIADRALPQDPLAYFFLLGALIQSHDLAGGKQVWSRLVQLHMPFESYRAFPFVDALLEAGDIQGAVRCWNDLGKVAPALAALSEPGNLIHNASFEAPVSQGTFDWRYLSGGEVEVQSDVSAAHDGQRSLLLNFPAGRAQETGIRQYIPVEPGSYRFTGFLKGELLTADGLAFVLLNARTGTELFHTLEFTHSPTWTQVSAEFSTSEPALGLLLLRRAEPSLARGNVWVDDLRLEKISK